MFSWLGFKIFLWTFIYWEGVLWHFEMIVLPSGFVLLLFQIKINVCFPFYIYIYRYILTAYLLPWLLTSLFTDLVFFGVVWGSLQRALWFVLVFFFPLWLQELRIMFITKTIKQAKKKKEQKVFVNVKLGPYFYIVLTINIAFAFWTFKTNSISFYSFSKEGKPSGSSLYMLHEICAFLKEAT